MEVNGLHSASCISYEDQRHVRKAQEVVRELK